MKRKTYADYCLDLAKKATKGPWCDGGGSSSGCGVDTASGYRLLWIEPLDDNHLADCDFIASSRTMVPKLSNKLKKAIKGLRATKVPEAMSLADKLEKGD